MTASGTITLNKGSGTQDLPSHTITFQYEVQDPFELTMASSLKKFTTGNLNVSGSIKWKVRDATLTDIIGGLSRCLYEVNTLLLFKETSTHSQKEKSSTFMGSASQLLNQPQCVRPKSKI